MIKYRSARYCNLKLFLLYLVIYGHLIEPLIGQSPGYLLLYKIIYLFHMPLFAFLSGLFLCDAQACGRQLRKTGLFYLLFQTPAVLLSGGSITLLTPYWHLWYLLSCCAWSGLGWLWFRFGRASWKLPLLAGAVLAGCAAGFVPFLGRTLSASRTVVFFPYFFLGLLCSPDTPWQRLRPAGLTAAGLAVGIFCLAGNRLTAAFLYQADPFGSLPDGFGLRLLCYALAGLLGLFFLAFAPRRRFFITAAGADTLPGYLLHPPVLLCLRQLTVPTLLIPLIPVCLLYAAHRLELWYGRLYSIISIQRRDRRWRLFKKSTKSMPSRSTDSSCP